MDVNFRFQTQSCHSPGEKFDNLDDRFRLRIQPLAALSNAQNHA